MALCYAISFILFITGVAFYTGKAAARIKGFQDLPEADKKAINIKPLCRNLSVMFFLAAVIFGIAGYCEPFRLGYFKLAMTGWLALCCADIVFINKSKRYVNQN